MAKKEKDILDQYEDVMSTGEDFLARERKIIPVSPRIDIALGGGILEGSFTVLTGREKAGKTITALTIAANAQRPEFGERMVYFLNIEGRLQRRDLEGIEGLDTSKERFRVYESKVGRILNAGEFLQIAEDIIHHKPNSVIVIDSFSSLVTEGELSGKLTDATVMEQAKLLAKFCRRNGTVIPANNITLVGITHKMSSVARGGRGPSTQEKSGNAIRYQVDNKLDATSYSYENEKKDGSGDIIGQLIYWQVKTSALGPPGQKFEGYVRYGVGLDKYRELLEVGRDFGVVDLNGSWYAYDGTNIGQGIQKAVAAVREDQELYDKIMKDVREIAGLDDSMVV